jgi:8-oxo-dGTP pyrophosphatase MutT (NUDIX family)
MDHGNSSRPARWSRGSQPSAKFLRLAQLRKLRRCEQVAAVCFRTRSAGIEFLLVQTRKERWIFPKGSAEPGLTHAQAAALEAFEEAGVHGRMEEISFTRYIQRKRRNMRRAAATELAVSAHLCEVLRLGPPEELNRNPTWFSPDKAKRRLREDRAPEYGAELARVIDRAVTRIQRLRSASATVSPRLPSVLQRGFPKDLQRSDLQRKDAPQRARFIEIDSARVTTVRARSAAAG